MTQRTVDLLRTFISSQTDLGGPFDNADVFFVAMKELLADESAMSTLREAWQHQQVQEALDTDKALLSHDEVFRGLQLRMQARLTKQVRQDSYQIKDDAHALQIILKRLDDEL